VKYFFKFIEVSEEGGINKNNENILQIIKYAESSYKERIPIKDTGYKSANTKKN